MAIRGLDPDYGAHVVADLTRRHLATALVPPIVAGLSKAGLDVRAPARPCDPAWALNVPGEAGATDFVVRLAFLGLFTWWSLQLDTRNNPRL